MFSTFLYFALKLYHFFKAHFVKNTLVLAGVGSLFRATIERLKTDSSEKVKVSTSIIPRIAEAVKKIGGMF